MFSTKHLEAHRPQGYFADKYDKVLGRYAEFFLGYFYGDLPELGRTVHVRVHHKENGGPEDTVATSQYDRTNRLHFLWYLSDNIWTTLGIVPYAYFRARGDAKNARRMLWGLLRYAVYFAAVFVYDWRIGLLYVLVPLLAMNFIMSITSWVQHAFCDPATSRRLFCEYRNCVRRSELHERGIPPRSPPPLWAALERNAHAYGADTRKDERVRLSGLPRHGFHGTLYRVDPAAQNACPRGEACAVGADGSPNPNGFVGGKNQACAIRFSVIVRNK